MIHPMSQRWWAYLGALRARRLSRSKRKAFLLAWDDFYTLIFQPIRTAIWALRNPRTWLYIKVELRRIRRTGQIKVKV